MSTSKKFRFVSPGVFIDEIDRSQIPSIATGIGPVIIGRTQRGPGMVPVTVNSWDEYTQTFGGIVDGRGSSDPWRDGNTSSPHYASLAARAYLANSGPVTIVRLLGTQSEDKLTTGFEFAGWRTENLEASTSSLDNGGAYGLFIIPSASSYASDVTGTLAAIWYLDKGSIRLKGNDFAGNDVGNTGAGVFVASCGANNEFQAVIENQNGDVVEEVKFNFKENSSNYIRSVFNTNPTLTNEDITSPGTGTDPVPSGLKTYWLGETFGNHLQTIVPGASEPAKSFGVIAALENASVTVADFEGVEAKPAKTGWVFSQDMSSDTGSFDPENMTKLFRFVVNRGEGSGEWEQNALKISILDIKPSTNDFNKYGSFTVAVRKAGDTDADPQFIELFTNCNLDPKSANFVGEKIGDKRIYWDNSERRHRELGTYSNKSKYIRIELNPVIEDGGISPESLPFGFYGPTRFKPITVVSGTTLASSNTHDPLMLGTGSIPDAAPAGSGTIAVIGETDFTASLIFPSLSLRVSASEANTPTFSDAYYGIIDNRPDSIKLYDQDYQDHVRAKPEGVDEYTAGDHTEYSFIFTLDDVRATLSPGGGGDPLNPDDVDDIETYWERGSRAAGSSLTAVGDYSASLGAGDDGYKRLIEERGHDRFTMPLFGGFDGLDITEKDPFRNEFLNKDTRAKGNYAVHTLRRAIDSIRDPEVLDMNLALIPGITNEGVINYLIDTVENRSDALAIIDLPGGYVPKHENNSDESQRLGSVTSIVNNLRTRVLNTSYACTYHPWVRIRSPFTNAGVWVPPSVVALGTMASSQERSAVWFAPAGFNRGGLTEGAAGLQVVDVREKLTSRERDKLYEVNINPIASFPSEGIVVFGQKTLQVTQSALDRINVRRLLIFLRKQISRIASSILFDQNIQITWNRFLGQVNPFLANVKANFGITDFRVILDESTTTPDLVDRNILYAKIFLKPARSIEFIAVDFIITRSGASFEDL